MAKDPAFLFYPGDYLRDTQCLSEASQTAYDRIMCEHMRNICISQEQLNFFTKRLNPEQKQELLMVLTKISGGFQISWVAESIQKRREYSDSRRKNRKGKEPNPNNISKSYVQHMENEIVIENVITNNLDGVDFSKPDVNGDEVHFPVDTPQVRQSWARWKEYRMKTHQKKYPIYGEQSALKQLAGMSEHSIIATIEKAIESNWFNLYPQKDKSNGTGKKGFDANKELEHIANYLNQSGQS